MPRAAASPAARLQSVDALRGAIMIIMAIDHIRDFIHRGAMSFSPTDLTVTTAPIFFTRWITHFCAPVFMLSAGIGAYLWMQRGGHSKAELSRFLVTRGVWLILLETTILRWVMFSEIHFRNGVVILLILWALGVSMIALAALAHLPMRVLAVLSVIVIAMHNLLDPVRPEIFGRAAWLWDILHQQALFRFLGVNFVTGYPVLPWIFVMAGGYCLGEVFLWEADRRRRFLLRLGLLLSVAFLVLRAVNVYGDPSPRTHQASALLSVLSFLNTTKYPPSLEFLLMTLGPALILLSWLDGLRFSSSNPLIVFGRVPFFYYVGHLVVIHAGAILLNFLRYGNKPFLWLAAPSMGGPRELFPPDYGFDLWVVYAFWIATVAILYPACLWFSRLKQRRHDWWLSYL
jgi:uncharacterized membrane protein